MVQVEGTAEIAEPVPPVTGVGEYVEKYRESVARIDLDPESFAWVYSVVIGSGLRAGRSGRPQEPKLRRGHVHKPLLGQETAPPENATSSERSTETSRAGSAARSIRSIDTLGVSSSASTACAGRQGTWILQVRCPYRRDMCDEV